MKIENIILLRRCNLILKLEIKCIWIRFIMQNNEKKFSDLKTATSIIYKHLNIQMIRKILNVIT